MLEFIWIIKIYSIKVFCLSEFILFSVQIRLKIIIMHCHDFFEQMPCQLYDLKFGMAESSMFLCDDVFLAVISWCRGTDNDNDAHDDDKNSHHLFSAYHKPHTF